MEGLGRHQPPRSSWATHFVSLNLRFLTYAVPGFVDQVILSTMMGI